MTDELVLYTNPQSRGRIARWMLEEVGQPYRTVILDYGTTMKSNEYLAINPMGKVPAVTHGGEIITECAAVCAYLADAFPEAGLAPPLPERARYYRWLFFTAGPVEAAVVNKALNVQVSPDRERMVGYGNMDCVLRALEGALKDRDYIASDRFTAADVYVGSAVGWGTMFGTLPKRQAFTDYFARLSSREAFLRAAQRDDALVAEQASA